MEIKNNWLDPKNLLSEYGVSITTQNRLRMERKIPYSKIGKMVRYNRDEIETWFSDHKVN
jgi:predicted DNA-binding transcriptional regulator AlpA